MSILEREAVLKCENVSAINADSSAELRIQVLQQARTLAEDYLVYSRIALLEDRVEALTAEITQLVMRHLRPD